MEDKLDKLIKEVEELKEEIKKLNKEIIIDSEELEDKDVIDIESHTRYHEGKPTETTIKYKYKETKSTCPEIIPEDRPSG